MHLFNVMETSEPKTKLTRRKKTSAFSSRWISFFPVNWFVISSGRTNIKTYLANLIESLFAPAAFKRALISQKPISYCAFIYAETTAILIFFNSPCFSYNVPQVHIRLIQAVAVSRWRTISAILKFCLKFPSKLCLSCLCCTRHNSLICTIKKSKWVILIC